MMNFSHSPEFEKEFKRLSKKYPSLTNDLKDLEGILASSPMGIGKNFVILKSLDLVQIVKTRVYCDSLRSRAVRLIYSYQRHKLEFMCIEIYFKGDKESEDKERIEKYLKGLGGGNLGAR